MGFALAAEAGADPVRVERGEAAPLTTLALEVYRDAQLRDPWPETGPGGTEQGTSLLAGAQASQARGLFQEYRWADDVDELVVALTTTTVVAERTGVEFGPAVVAVAWYESMYQTDPEGVVKVAGELVGYHAILIRGVLFRLPGVDEPVLRWRNSWGPTYGDLGDGLIRASDLTRVLGAQPEILLPVRRQRP